MRGKIIAAALLIAAAGPGVASPLGLDEVRSAVHTTDSARKAANLVGQTVHLSLTPNAQGFWDGHSDEGVHFACAERAGFVGGAVTANIVQVMPIETGTLITLDRCRSN